MQMIAFDPVSGAEIAKEQRFPWPPNQAVQNDFASRTGGLVYLDQGSALGNNPVKATIVDGQVVEVAIDPDYVPPAPVPDPVQARLEALEATLERIPLNTPHNRRWLAQKERVKAAGIAYIQAHPACAQVDLEQALAADLTAGFPGEPIVVNAPGVIQSYADTALAQGFIAEASFPALRDLVAASSPDQIQAMLQVL